MFKRLKTRFQKIGGSIWFYLAIFIVCLLILKLTFNVYPTTDFWGNVRVEFVGFCFDVLFLGLFLSIFTHLQQRKQDIKRWEEEIDDYRGWNEPEAMYRIVGNIKRLNREGVTKINLRNCYLAGANLFEVRLNSSDLVNANLEGADLRRTYLEDADLSEANLKKARFDQAYLKEAIFSNAYLEHANFIKADLDGVRFNKAHLQGTSFSGVVNIEKADFRFSHIEGTHFDDVEWLNNLQEKEDIELNARSFKFFSKYYAEPSMLFGFIIKLKPQN